MAKDTSKPAKEPKVKAAGVGATAMELLKKGLSNEEVLAELKKKFPDAKTSMASVNWYRNKARSEGVAGVKTSREINAGKPNPAREAREKEKAAKKAAREKAAAEKKAAKEKAAAEKAKAKEKAAAEKAKAKERQDAEKAKAKAAAEKAKAKAAKEKAKGGSVLD